MQGNRNLPHTGVALPGRGPCSVLRGGLTIHLRHNSKQPSHQRNTITNTPRRESNPSDGYRNIDPAGWLANGAGCTESR